MMLVLSLHCLVDRLLLALLLLLQVLASRIDAQAGAPMLNLMALYCHILPPCINGLIPGTVAYLVVMLVVVLLLLLLLLVVVVLVIMI
jgi:hypothetical protein